MFGTLSDIPTPRRRRPPRNTTMPVNPGRTDGVQDMDMFRALGGQGDGRYLGPNEGPVRAAAPGVSTAGSDDHYDALVGFVDDPSSIGRTLDARTPAQLAALPHKSAAPGPQMPGAVAPANPAAPGAAWSDDQYGLLLEGILDPSSIHRRLDSRTAAEEAALPRMTPAGQVPISGVGPVTSTPNPFAGLVPQPSQVGTSLAPRAERLIRQVYRATFGREPTPEEIAAHTDNGRRKNDVGFAMQSLQYVLNAPQARGNRRA